MDDLKITDPELLRGLTASWLQGLPSPSTREAYRADLQAFARWAVTEQVDLLRLGGADLRVYRVHCEASGSSAATVARRLSALVSFAEFAHSHGHGGGSGHVERPIRPTSSTADVLTPEDASALVVAADRISIRSGLVVRLLMLDGLKVSEAVRIDVADISGRPPHVTLALHGARPRSIELHADTADLVRSHLGARSDGPLLLSDHSARRTQRLTRFGVGYILKRAANEAGIASTVSANALRRAFVIAAHARGDELDEIRRHVGHGDTRTTRRYLEQAPLRDDRGSRAPPDA
jgi:site-specific recombinase XerD